jgi:poly(hydroxyalkanoate) granule-associated protein
MAAKEKGEAKGERKVAEELRDSAHKIWLAGLGAMAAAEQEGSKFFKQLVERGEEFESRGRERVEEMRGRASERFGQVSDRFTGGVEEQVAKALKRLGVPSRDEIEALSKKIDHLSGKLDKVASKNVASKSKKGPATP